MDLQMANARHLLIGLDLLVAKVSPFFFTAPNNFANNESAFYKETLPTKINSYNVLFLPGALGSA